MLSNISPLQMNTAYPSTRSPLQQYKHLTISHIITIKRHTQKQWCLPRQNATKSQPPATPTRVVNLVMRLKKALLLNCSNFALSLVFSYAALAAQLYGNQSVKIKQPSVPVNPKSWPPMSAPRNSNPWSIVTMISEFHNHTLEPKSTTTTRQPFNGRLQWPQKYSST